MPKLRTIRQCAFCRRRVMRERCDPRYECKGHPIYLTCRKHRNRPVYVRFSMAPVSIGG